MWGEQLLKREHRVLHELSINQTNTERDHSQRLGTWTRPACLPRLWQEEMNRVPPCTTVGVTHGSSYSLDCETKNLVATMRRAEGGKTPFLIHICMSVWLKMVSFCRLFYPSFLMGKKPRYGGTWSHGLLVVILLFHALVMQTQIT